MNGKAARRNQSSYSIFTSSSLGDKMKRFNSDPKVTKAWVRQQNQSLIYKLNKKRNTHCH